MKPFPFLIRIKFFQRPTYYPSYCFWEKGNILVFPVKDNKLSTYRRILKFAKSQDNSGKKPYLVKNNEPSTVKERS
jgi:hypothetical protein